MLIVLRDGSWHTVRTFDNAHGAEEHHEHRYIGTEKQAPIVTSGSVNDVMSAAIDKLLNGWDKMVESWETTR